MKKLLMAAVALTALPVIAQAQSLFTPTNQPFPGFYVGPEGGLNWLLNSGNYNMDLGYAVGGVVGEAIVGRQVPVGGLRGDPPGGDGIDGDTEPCVFVGDTLEQSDRRRPGCVRALAGGLQI